MRDENHIYLFLITTIQFIFFKYEADFKYFIIFRFFCDCINIKYNISYLVFFNNILYIFRYQKNFLSLLLYFYPTYKIFKRIR